MGRFQRVFLFAAIAVFITAASARGADLRETLELVEPLRQAVSDLTKAYPEQYPGGAEYLKSIARHEKRLQNLSKNKGGSDEAVAAFMQLRREALLGNPLLDFKEMLAIKRVPKGGARREKGDGKGLGEFLGLPRQSSWQQDTIPDIDKWENEIAAVTLPTATRLNHAPSRRLYKPEKTLLVSDIDLDYDAGRLLFAMPGDNRCWQVFGADLKTMEPRQISPSNQPGIHNFDPVRLPDNRILYVSTAPLQGVPCNASVNTAMNYIMNADGGGVRQLCFDQDHNYCPTVMNDGRVMYLRWEYTDIPHVWGRYLFTMNPDGTSQREFYGSGSYWPNSIFYARPVPGHPTKVIGVVTGHHVGRVGELVLFDPAQSHNGVEGAVQRIPRRGKELKPLIEDKLTEFSWPKYLHPFPLSERYFIVSAKPSPGDLWGIYLVDIFDNMLLLKEEEGHALLEPIPLRKRVRPPVIPDRVDLKREDAIIYLEDIYKGPGLREVPRDAVKQLRLFTYHFAYQRIAGISHRVGADGPWEPKRVLGTVPVESDGSAFFRVPANTPISFQPIDAKGQALQLMRSWATAMPGETVSCVGCHERQSKSPPPTRTIAARRAPSEIEPWRGPVRGFSFVNEIQPVLDKNCVGCHDGSSHGEHPMPDFRGGRDAWYVLKSSDPGGKVVEGEPRSELFKKYAGVFPPSYAALRSFVRVGGLESDIRQLFPSEFHANTTELMQGLAKGHYGVKLNAEEWERLSLWIDLNAPCHGTWSDVAGAAKTKQNERRRALRATYGGDTVDPETPPTEPKPVEFIEPKRLRPPRFPTATATGWPFDADKARRLQKASAARLGVEPEISVDLGDGVALKLTLIPAGAFVMGSERINPDERPALETKVKESFWIGKFEITNAQYNKFNPSHDSRYEHKGSWSFSEGHLGWLLNKPEQPVVRVSNDDAEAFAAWLSEKIGMECFLPTEAQWEYACRAGTATPHWFGSARTDFSPYGNMADVTIRELTYDTDGRYCADLAPRDTRFDDGALVTAKVGSYKPNPWGLHDVHGNVWEWTSSAYGAYAPAMERFVTAAPAGSRVARGGSWYDRPKRCRSGFRLHYPAWQRVFNVGFRIAAKVKNSKKVMADGGE